MEQNTTFPSLFDSSMLASYKACQVKFWRTHIQHWKPIGESVHLVSGGAFAKGLEAARKAFFSGIRMVPIPVLNEANRITGYTWEDQPCESGNAALALTIGLAALMAKYGTFECPADSAKSLERTMGALEFYFDHYPLTWDDSVPILLANGSRAIEFSFAHPLPILHPETGDPILYTGSMDAVIATLGDTFICDEKTTTQLGATWSSQWDLRAQFTGYAWGCREAGIRVAGAVVRGVSILKTKYDTLAPVTYRPEWLIETWYSEMLETIDEIVQKWKTGKWRHNFDESCQAYGGCGLKRICLSQTPDPWLETYFEKKVWNPVTKEEKKL